MTDDTTGPRRRVPVPAGMPDRAPDETAVLRFLEARPDFLARHPSLYLTLAPPARVHGDVLADHMAAMLDAARRRSAMLADTVRSRRESASFGGRVETAILHLLRAADPLEWAAGELASTLGLDSAAIALERPRTPHARTLPPGALNRLLSGRDIHRRDEPRDALLLHGELSSLVRRDVLVRLRPGGPAGVSGILALGNRDDALPGPGTDGALGLLGRAIEAALERP